MSKSRLLNVILVTTLLLTLSHEATIAQGKPVKSKVKSLVVMEEKYDGPETKIYKESETNYDINGNIIEEIEFKDGNFVSHFIYEYDADNNKIKESELDKSGSVIKVSVYKYENGLRVEKSVYDGKGKLKSKKKYNYTTF